MEGLISAPVTLALIAANVIASLYAFQNDGFREDNLFWIAPMREGGQWHRLVTSAFLHGDPTHLFINMYVLYIFGMPLEGALGPVNFLIVYVASLLGGNLWELVDKWRTPQYRALGASGATSGLTMSFVLFAPFAILLFLFIIPMWAIVFGIGFIIGSYIYSRKEGTMIAHGAHLGGALAGLITTALLRPDVFQRFLDQIAGKFG